MYNKITAFFKIIRWPNLFIMAITMYFVRYFLIVPHYQKIDFDNLLSPLAFILLTLSVVFIAAGGNIINDYFDIRVDNINKPQKRLINSIFSMAETKTLYFVTTGIGFILGLIVCRLISSWELLFVYIAIVGLLYFYSARYKNIPVVGNLVVAFCSAMVIVIVWLADVLYYANDIVLIGRIEPIMQSMTFLVFAYAIFAFVVSWIREIMKDLQDYEGDKICNSNTMPVAWGIKTSKIIVCLLIIILLSLIVFWQLTLYDLKENIALYSLFVCDALCIAMIMQIINAKDKTAFGVASSMAKITMLVGIASIALINYL